MKSRRRPVMGAQAQERLIDRFFSADLARLLPSVLETIDPFELRVIVQVARGVPYNEIAAQCALPTETVRRVYSTAMSRMRHPSRSQVLRDFLDIDLSRYVQADAVFGIKFETVNCPTHGQKAAVQDSRRCLACPCEIAYLRFNTTPGRRRRYCSPACRQSAYRRRKNTAVAASLTKHHPDIAAETNPVKEPTS
ncbi:RNA polymerase sigma factor SigB [Mycobacteroides abscessus subsp. abscessus]|nr:RNA polymerase sigma factor SigB [Mycobacteroides abscessus subsp. abscessus]SIG00238.1 RNA polymerase sigma factor SigB [Mycobacteroides abscessus subsp. abscessus]SIG17071.1 RNA polymerase sigma factor SigB [Mycobacteroides abscessus subsp. abscessus]SIG50856.1 RNA polymerase sigma factor SigB [Mycobacteroides abscessus subsp. abscessus]SII32810.1 RNA polymerase sigma factor SigB [Mycobacteroides abscessus subsp. abscessus]